MQQHIVSAFSKDLDHLLSSLLGMGGLAEEMTQNAIRAVLTHDHALAKNVVESDKTLDRRQGETEKHLVRLLALRQPMAGDLRTVIGGIKIAGTLERIGDLAKNTARRGLELETLPDPTLARGLKRMSDLVLRQLNDVLAALSQQDAVRALRVIEQDDDIDRHQDALLRAIMIALASDPDTIQSGSNFLFIVKNFERIGDHCTNIAKTVYYIATGERVADQAVSGMSQPTELDELEEQG